MIALLPLMLLAAQAAAPVEPPPVAIVPAPPADWTTLPDLVFTRPWANAPDLSAYVRAEVRAGRCAASGKAIKVDLAVLVAAGGQVRRIVPRAINCPTVEQYASGLVSRMARSNVVSPSADGWFRTALVFTLE